MILDLCLTAAGILLFSVPAFLKNGKLSLSKKNLVNLISKNTVLSGVFVSVAEILMLFSELENVSDLNELSFSSFIVMILLKFRPFLVSVLIRLVLIPFGQSCSDKKTVDSNGDSSGNHSGDSSCNSYSDSASDSSDNSSGNKTRVKDKLNFELLSPREKEVARLASLGYSNMQIADELFISVETVKRHLANIFEKMKISSRYELRQFK